MGEDGARVGGCGESRMHVVIWKEKSREVVVFYSLIQ